MPKDYFVFYVDAQRAQRGYQSKHVATVVIRRPTGFSNCYQVGVAAKHQKDKLPFTKSEGRRIARERALTNTAIQPNLELVIDEVNHGLYTHVKDIRTLSSIRVGRLNTRIREVLCKFDPTLAPKRTVLRRLADFVGWR